MPNANRTIYINGRYLTQAVSGVQRYAGEIVAALDKRVGAGDAGAHYVLLSPRAARDAGLLHIEQRRIGRFNGHLWDQISFALAAANGVGLCLAATGPVLLTRQLAVIHDASVQRYPEMFGRAYSIAHRFIDVMLARRAKIATVSEFSRRELADVLRIKADSIVVAKNAVDHIKITPDPDIVDSLGLTSTPYFMTVGNLSPNKNLALVIRALGELGAGSAKLVAVGRMDSSVFGNRGLPPITPDVILAGRLTDEQVAGLMRSAKALIFPSFYEGFGIPPLEAMSNDCPVLASTAAAVVETCEGAADFFDPRDPLGLARLMRRALDDDGSWRNERISAGRQRLLDFSWARSADILASTVEEMAR